jgi:peptidoglycan/LPS O-acetylase OafA/YrhL
MTPRRGDTQYRPDIDGIRAVAVLAVVGFHAFPHAVHGGFVGVDVFLLFPVI